MPIICPQCTTSYAVDASTFGPEGRAVRCARCKEVWTAYPDPDGGELVFAEAMPAAAATMTEQRFDVAPEIASPSIAGDWPDEVYTAPETSAVRDAMLDAVIEGDAVTMRSAGKARPAKRGVKPRSKAASLFGLNAACVAMTALVAALMIWRADIVRLMPQTATFYKYAGFAVNLRGLDFKDVAVNTEMLNGKPALTIAGVVANIVRRPVEMPRLRMILRDDKGSEIYAWNAVLEQPGLNPGASVPFRTQLAAPPAEARTLDVRFFLKRDLAGGGT